MRRAGKGGRGGRGGGGGGFHRPLETQNQQSFIFGFYGPSAGCSDLLPLPRPCFRRQGVWGYLFIRLF